VLSTSSIDNGSSDACGIQSLVLSESQFSCADVGSNTVVLTVTDLNSNSSSCTTVVTVLDTILPVALCKNATVHLDLNGNGVFNSSSIDNGSSDSCGIQSLVLSEIQFSCADVGSNSVVLTVTDLNSNSSSCTAVVTVLDTTLPVALCQNVTVHLDLNGNGVLSSSSVDNGSNDACGIQSLMLNETQFSCADVGSNTVVLTVTDLNSNSSSCTTVVTVLDTILPVALCQNVSVYLDFSGNGVVNSSSIDNGSSDSCGIQSLVLSESQFSCSGVGSNTVVLTVTDLNSNSSSCTAVVTVLDTISPQLVCPTSISVSNDPDVCGAVVVFSFPQGSDNCSGWFSEQIGGLPSDTLFPVGSTVQVFLVTDASGNTASCSFEVSVEDVQLPTISCPANLELCFPAIPVFSEPVGLDNCPGVSTSQLSGAGSGSVFPIGTTTNLYEAVDASGNTATCSFTVTIHPLPELVTLAGGGAVCNSDTTGVPVSLLASELGILYQLQLNGMNVGLPIAGTGLALSFGPQLPTGTYTVLATNAVTACTSVMSGSVEVTTYDCLAEIADPCACLNNATTLVNGQFAEEVMVSAPSSQTWTVSAVVGLFDENSPNPPVIPTPISQGTALTNFGGNQFVLRGKHIDAIGYTVTVSNGLGTSLSIGNTCSYPNPSILSNLNGPFCLYSDSVALVGNPGDSTVVLEQFTVNGLPAQVFYPSMGTGTYVIEYAVDGGLPGPNDPGCIQSVRQLIQVVETSSTVVCKDSAVVALDLDCSTVLGADQLLEGSYSCFDDYLVQLDRQLPFGNGPWMPGEIAAADIGRTFSYQITHQISGNSCWGMLSVEDKLPPQLTCPANITIACSQSTDPMVTGQVQVSDCSVVSFQLDDEVIDYGECGNPRQEILRLFIGTDAWGNQSICSQYIQIRAFDLSEMLMPADITVDCEELHLNPLATSPAFTGQPSIQGVSVGNVNCSAGMGFSDVELAICAGSFEILRTWTVTNTCISLGQGNPLTHTQRIRVKDFGGPTFTCPANLTVSTDASNCCATAALPSVVLSEGCSQVQNLQAKVTGTDPSSGNLTSFTVQGSLMDFSGNNYAYPDTLAVFPYTECLPVNTTYTVKYTAKDGCGNLSSCQFEMTIEDLVPPALACDEFTQVALAADGTALVNAGTFDDGSVDNCGPVFFKARRMNGNDCQTDSLFHDEVKFCCSDLSDTVSVILRVYDASPASGSIGFDAHLGNYNDCMVNVLIEDKIKPICTAPANVTVSCEAFDPSLWAYETATGQDNCCMDTITYSVAYNQFDTLCNKGTITRRWTAVDCGGNTASCSQRVIVTYN
ncbi:MAG: HYR domain-containing protein, partial [Chitinophagales bacterium]